MLELRQEVPEKLASFELTKIVCEISLKSGVGVRHSLALPQHCWSVQQAWGDQEVQAANDLSKIFFGKEEEEETHSKIDLSGTM